MIGALRYEWARITSIRSTWWITAIAFVLAFGFSLLIGHGISSEPQAGGLSASYAAVITQGASTGFAPVLVAYLMGLLGVFTFGHEYRHGMIRATLTAVPRRWTVLGAKALVVLGWALVVSVLCLALGVLAGQITLRGVGFSVTGGDLPRVMAGFVVYVCLFTLVGLAIAAVVRSQAAALGLLLLIPLVVENVLRLVITLPDAFNDVEGVVRYFPFDAGSRMLVLFPLNAGEVFGPIPLGPLSGGVTFAVFSVVVLALGGLLFVRRDA